MKTFFKLLMISLLILTASLAVVRPVLATGYDECDPNKRNLSNGLNCSIDQDKKNKLFDNGGIFTTITNTLLFLIGAVSVIMIIYAGIQYATSGGDSGKVTSAKNTILYAVVGIVVAVLAYAIVNFVVSSMAGTATPSGLIRLF